MVQAKKGSNQLEVQEGDILGYPSLFMRYLGPYKVGWSEFYKRGHGTLLPNNETGEISDDKFELEGGYKSGGIFNAINGVEVVNTLGLLIDLVVAQEEGVAKLID